MAKKVKDIYALVLKAQKAFDVFPVLFSNGILTRQELRTLEHRGFLKSGVSSRPGKRMMVWQSTEELMDFEVPSTNPSQEENENG